MTQNSAPIGISGASDDPGAKLLPAPVVHPDLAALAALSVADEERPALRVKVALGEIQRL